MNLLNREQLTSLWIGIIVITAMGLVPPWREATGNLNALNYAPLSQPPAATVGVTVDYARLLLQWLITMFITGGFIASFQKVEKRVDNSLPVQQSGPAVTVGSGEKSSPTAPQSTSSSAIVENSGRSRSSSSGRTLSFPTEAIGDLLIESEEDREYWEFFARAAGSVIVPVGKRLQLELDKRGETKLSHLRNLPSDAFYSLDFSGVPVTDGDLDNIGHLSGVREIDLSDTSVSDVGIKSLAGLKNLKKLWLDNTRVTDKGLEELLNNKELAKVSLIGTGVDESQAQTLVKSLAQSCEIVLVDNG
ncbi:MAG TPA: hypothetical protein V6C86_13685 [Oculatellaceae cyanobacterium]